MANDLDEEKENRKVNKKGYSKRPLRFWVLIYIVIAIVVYAIIYLLFFHHHTSSNGTSTGGYSY